MSTMDFQGIWASRLLRVSSDVLCVALLLLTAILLLLIHYDALPMQVWDESRNANNALEMARNGHWLVPHYAGLPEHWNTKPPLLIWLIAGFMRLGFPPLLALRLPAALAAMASTAAIWVICRAVLHDRLAAIVAGLLPLTSSLYMGLHGAGSGNYDALEGFFVLAYLCAFWASLETRRGLRYGWLAIFGVALFCAVLTKGIAAALPLPGLVIFAVARGRLVEMLSSWRVWLLMLTPVAACFAYYLTRPLYDPGYLSAVAANELGGRYAATNEGHGGSAWFYIWVLWEGFRAGLFLLPCVLISFLRWRHRRGSLALLCLICVATLLGVASTSRTKIDWYAVPTIPLLAIAAGIGVSDGVSWLKQRGARLLPAPAAGIPALAAIGAVALLLAVSLHSSYARRLQYIAGSRLPQYSQLWYGRFLGDLARSRLVNQVIVVDDGLVSYGSPRGYDPLLKFYATLAEEEGMRVAVVSSGARLPMEEFLASCDPASLLWLRGHFTYVLYYRETWCDLIKLVSPIQNVPVLQTDKDSRAGHK
jgi:4-amino-4-deoxy-L-arabinose transferase-like glycosyltransferase